MERVKNKKIMKSSFFLDSGKTKSGDGTGYVFRKYPPPKPVRKTIPLPTLPDTEEQMSTKDVCEFCSIVHIVATILTVDQTGSGC